MPKQRIRNKSKSSKPSSEKPKIENHPAPVKVPVIKLQPRNKNQADYIEAIHQNDITFGFGPAGVGKSWLACALAAKAYKSKEFEKILLVRPCLEVAGERLGFLPGTLEEKAGPYLAPLLDAIGQILGKEQLLALMNQGDIEVAPLAYMRGRTLKHSFIILDEAQNTTVEQMIMAVTRLGEGSKMVINGDLTQTDLPKHVKSGLRFAEDVYGDVKGLGWVYFDNEDVVRHPLVGRLVKAHEDWKERKV